jgi:hypothetical protein
LLAKDRERLRKLHGLVGSSNPNEAEVARQMIREILDRHNLSWNDLPDLLREESASEQQADEQTTNTAFDFNPLDLVHHLIGESISLTEDQMVAVTLWIAHCYFYERFRQSPRLFLSSPVRGCGKTTLLYLIERLTPNAQRIDGVSDAGLFHILGERPTLLLDEVDNADLPSSSIKRRVLNAGHRSGTKESRVMNGSLKHYSLFAPVALAAIKRLHLPLMDRSIVIKMERSKKRLPDFDEDDAALVHVRVALEALCATSSPFLNTKPELPTALRNRYADNWRPLISAADLCGASELHDWPALARQAALAFSESREEDPEIALIRDCRIAFRTRGVDRLKTDDLLAVLHASDGPWAEWTGVKGNKPPHPLRRHELAELLVDFNIKPRVFNQLRRRPGDKSARGYLANEFESAWAAYGPADVTP